MVRKRRLTVSEKSETVAVFYGINPRSFEVDTVFVTRDGHMTKYGKGGFAHDHYNEHGNMHETEIKIVYGLTDLFNVRPELLNSELTKQQLENLRTRAEKMRSERDTAKQKKTAS